MRAVLTALALGSAIVGGAVGASAALWALGDDHGKAKPARSTAPGAAADSIAPEGTAIDERVARLEASLRALERRRPLLAAPTPGTAPAGTNPSGSDPPGEPTLVDDPVFEAAVRDVIDRAEADRDQERELRREDRRRQMAERWAEELVPLLRLNPGQKAKLNEIAQGFMSELGKLWERDGGLPPPRAERRQKVQELRAEAETKLRSVLDPSQMSDYEKLDEDQKLGIPRRRGRD